MSTLQIPLSGSPERFSISLANMTYQMTLSWRDNALGGWVLDIGDASNIPLVTGLALTTSGDLLAPYPDLNFGGALYVINTAGGDAVPTFDNLGSDVILVFVTP